MLNGIGQTVSRHDWILADILGQSVVPDSNDGDSQESQAAYSQVGCEQGRVGLRPHAGVEPLHPVQKSKRNTIDAQARMGL